MTSALADVTPRGSRCSLPCKPRTRPEEECAMSDIPAGSPPGEPGGNPAQTAATRVFVDHRELLFSVTYNMLGSVADTEDVLQEAISMLATRNPGASRSFTEARTSSPRYSRNRVRRGPVTRHRAGLARSSRHLQPRERGGHHP